MALRWKADLRAGPEGTLAAWPLVRGPGLALVAVPLALASLSRMAWSFCSLGLRPVVRFGVLGGRLLIR